jgi:sec-independent protein translocase protein TatC
MDYVWKLSIRLSWIAAAVFVASLAAFPFVGGVNDVLVARLGDQQLFYLTSAGFWSMAKTGIFIGLTLALPVAVYHALRHFESVGARPKKPVAFYTFMSLLLAVAGVLFAYFVSLAPALHMFTGFGVELITITFTADSYMTFVLSYLFGTAALLQVPLLLIALNSAKRVSLDKLLSLLRYVVVIAFIASAVLTPTPDPVNLVIFAMPLVLTYLIGAGIVLMANDKKGEPKMQSVPAYVYRPEVTPEVSREFVAEVQAVAHGTAKQNPMPRPTVARQLDSVASRPSFGVLPRTNPFPRQQRTVPAVSRSLQYAYRPRPTATVASRSIDGFLPQRS